LFWSRKSLKQADAAVAALKAALAADLQRLAMVYDLAGASLFFYTEATAGSIETVMLVGDGISQMRRLHPPRSLAAHVREIWTQFRIAKLPCWHAFGITISAGGGTDIVFHYDECFDAGLTPDKRATRWLARAAGPGALHAMTRELVDVE
jgi:Protein of unknown function, DUF600